MVIKPNKNMYRIDLKLFLLLLFCIVLASCIHVPNNFQQLPPGVWRATLALESETPIPVQRVDGDISQVPVLNSSGELPFNFEVIYKPDGSFYIEIINGEERIRVDDIQYGRDPQTAKDTVLIEFTEYDSYIKAIFVENRMEGYWYVPYKGSYMVPFTAVHGQEHRFSSLNKKALMNISGSWESSFDINTESPWPAKGVFQQNDSRLLGTFLTETGDYRYLDGSILTDKIYLSCFDGAHAFLFEAKIQPDSSLYGVFYSGNHYKTEWVAIKNDGFKLANPYDLTIQDKGIEALDFQYTDLDGQKLLFSEFVSGDKPILIQIMGTWCPNCKDETLFLKEFFAAHENIGIDMLAVCFERYEDPLKSIDRIKRYKEKLNISYPMVLGGHYKKSVASEVFPMLNKISSYPTLLFVDKNQKIHKIHTGFSGPATSEYDSFKSEFQDYIEALKGI